MFWWLLALLVAAFVAVNARSLLEGVRYLYQAATWAPDRVQPVEANGPYALIHSMAGQTNAQRLDTILQAVVDTGLTPRLVPTDLPDAPAELPPSVWVPLSDTGPYIILCAHYDKSRETATYQAAADNTAAVVVALDLMQRLAGRNPEVAVGVLLTAAEEQGLWGARTFVRWAEENDLSVDQVINLDMLGRGKLATRPDGDPGFHFWLPGPGCLVFDGQHVARASRTITLPPHEIVAHLQEADGNQVIEYRRFAAYGDGSVFREHGWPTVTLSSDSMYYLDLVWEQDSDRVALLDQTHLAMATSVLERYALAGAGPALD